MRPYVIELNGSVVKRFYHLSAARRYFDSLCKFYDKDYDVIRLLRCYPTVLVTEF